MTSSLKDRVEDAVRASALAVVEAESNTGELPDFALEPPRSAEHGDFAANVAMLLAKPLRKKPRDIATAIASHLGDAGGLLASVEVAGPGFLNLRISDAEWQRALTEIVAAGDRLVFAGVISTIVELQRTRGLTPVSDEDLPVAPQRERRLVEAVISSSSPLIDQSIRDASFRTVYDAAVIAVHRNAERVPGKTLLPPHDRSHR